MAGPGQARGRRSVAGYARAGGWLRACTCRRRARLPSPAVAAAQLKVSFDAMLEL